MKLALAAWVCSLVWLGTGCGHDASQVGFAIPHGSAAVTLGVDRTRVVDRTVNMMEPLVLELDEEGAVRVTFARRGGDGTTLLLDPRTLETRSTRTFVYAKHERRGAPPCLAAAPANVLVGGAPVVAWTDGASSRVMAARSGTVPPPCHRRT